MVPMFDLLRLPLLQKAEVPEPKGREKNAWNAGVSVGKKSPLTKEEVTSLYEAFLVGERRRDLAMFTLAIDSMLRAGDLLKLKFKNVRDSTGKMRARIQVKQGKTKNPVICVLSLTARECLCGWIDSAHLCDRDFLFPGRDRRKHLCSRQYQEIVKRWVERLSLPPELYGTHSLRRTKSSMLYAATKDSAKVQIVLGQTTLAAAQQYLGVTEEEALKVAEEMDLFCD